VLVPIAVLARTLPENWEHRPIAVPAWFTGLAAPAAPRSVASPAVQPGRERAQPSLFEHAAPPATTAGVSYPAWIDQLLRAPTFVEHRMQARLPRPFDDDRLIRYLSVISANGGSIPLAALAERTGEPADQLRMALSIVQRLLNLDGASVLTVGADRSVHLDVAMLAMQFGLERP
jgi:hypothetical protein